MAALFRLRIVTPESTLVDEDVISVTAPGTEGYLGVLAQHAPLITALAPGKITVRNASGALEEYTVTGGFLQVADNRATVLADSARRGGGR